eukprot:6199999-Pleurochrysis_carterae.AAC.1
MPSRNSSKLILASRLASRRRKVSRAPSRCSSLRLISESSARFFSRDVLAGRLGCTDALSSPDWASWSESAGKAELVELVLEWVEIGEVKAAEADWADWGSRPTDMLARCEVVAQMFARDSTHSTKSA